MQAHESVLVQQDTFCSAGNKAPERAYAATAHDSLQLLQGVLVTQRHPWRPLQPHGMGLFSTNARGHDSKALM